jgi:glutathione S-transferase
MDQLILYTNPMGKVPALRHGDVLVTETAAICAYLADAFPAAELAPGLTDRARGPYLRWLFFAAGPIEAAVTNRALGVVLPAGRERMAGYGTYETTMNTLEQALAGQTYLVGDRFSTADLYVGAHLQFGMAFKTIETRPEFVRYADGLARRPAAIAARAIDDALAAPAG